MAFKRDNFQKPKQKSVLEKKIDNLLKNTKLKARGTMKRVAKTNFFYYFYNVNKHIFLNIFTIFFIFVNFLIIFDRRYNGDSAKILLFLNYFSKFEVLKPFINTLVANVDYILVGIVSLAIPALCRNVKGTFTFVGYLFWIVMTPKQSIFMHVFSIWTCVYLLRTKKYQVASILILVVNLTVFTIFYIIPVVEPAVENISAPISNGNRGR